MALPNHRLHKINDSHFAFTGVTWVHFNKVSSTCKQDKLIVTCKSNELIVTCNSDDHFVKKIS